MNKQNVLKPVRVFFVSIFLAVATWIASSCTSQAWYEGMQSSNKQECYRIPNERERQECIQRTEQSYKEYLEKKREVEKDKNDRE